MSAGQVLGIAAAGAVGAPARYVLDGFITSRSDPPFPRSTLFINVTGSLLLGIITGLALYHGLPSTPRLVLGTGFCGAYTTFSTFSFQTVRLWEEGEHPDTAGNVFLSVVLSTLAAGVGLALASIGGR